jgi:imidazoleglycerol-phosphate dehydratase
MLELFASHSGFGLNVKCIGDVEVDFHHTVEDVGIALGQAFLQAIGDKRGIKRYADITLPMDEALVLCAIDISGRGTLNYDVEIPSAKVSDDSDEQKPRAVGLFDTELIEEFFTAFTREAKITLHLVKMYGKNTHHIIECVFKAFARALKEAVKIEGDKIPSSKGIL